MWIYSRSRQGASMVTNKYAKKETLIQTLPYVLDSTTHTLCTQKEQRLSDNTAMAAMLVFYFFKDSNMPIR